MTAHRTTARRTAVLLTAVLAVLASLLVAAPASVAADVDGDVMPPWCGSPENDAAGNLPDGTQAGQPAGSFPHIPYYAMRCTLEDIVASSNGRMSLEVIGQSALGRDLFLVTVNALDTVEQRQDFHNWQQVRNVALTDPARGQQLLQSYGDRVKVPVFVQGAIHGNEYEGVEAIFETLHTLATTPYGSDPEVDAVLDHAVVLFNVIQNPDGRVAGTRANGNGFDLNRDFMTQSQPETRASVAVMQHVVAPRGPGPARLRHADAHRGDHQAAQPEHRLRPLAQVEPAAHRRQRSRAGSLQLRRHPPGQRLVRRRQPRTPERAVPGRGTARSCCRRGLGRLGPLLHADVRAARRPQRLDGRDVQPSQQHQLRGAGYYAARSRTAGLEDHPGDRRLVDPPVRHRQPQRAVARRARALLARRHQRTSPAVLRAAVRCRQQLDGGVPHRLHRADGKRPAQRARGEPPR